MTRTLFLLNALALAALMGLILQPHMTTRSIQGQGLPRMDAQLTVFETAANKTPAAIEATRMPSHAQQRRLAF